VIGQFLYGKAAETSTGKKE
jgi:phospholipid transport system substrate-binding protein